MNKYVRLYAINVKLNMFSEAIATYPSLSRTKTAIEFMKTALSVTSHYDGYALLFIENIDIGTTLTPDLIFTNDQYYVRTDEEIYKLVSDKDRFIFLEKMYVSEEAIDKLSTEALS